MSKLIWDSVLGNRVEVYITIDICCMGWDRGPQAKVLSEHEWLTCEVYCKWIVCSFVGL